MALESFVVNAKIPCAKLMKHYSMRMHGGSAPQCALNSVMDGPHKLSERSAEQTSCFYRDSNSYTSAAQPVVSN
jgi:hypothetical protein